MNSFQNTIHHKLIKSNFMSKLYPDWNYFTCKGYVRVYSGCNNQK